MTNDLHSTDIDREQKEKIDPAHTRHLLGMIGTFVMVGIIIVLCVILLIINADKVDSFMNTNAGAFTIVSLIGASAIAWFVWRIKRLIE